MLRSCGEWIMKLVDWVRDRGIVTLTPEIGVSSLVAKIGGAKIPARWWSASNANRIYKAYMGLVEDADILATKLVKGKVTLIHRRLWPELIRLTMDSNWRASVLKQLAPSPRHLLQKVEELGIVQLHSLVSTWSGGKLALK